MKNESIFSKIKALGLKIGEYVVVSGGVLEAHRLRKSGDVDLVVSQEVYKRLRDEGWEERMGVSTLILSKNNYEVATNCNYKNYLPDTKKLIEEADIINGCAFANLDETIKFKTEVAREKDKKDIELIEKYISATGYHSRL